MKQKCFSQDYVKKQCVCYKDKMIAEAQADVWHQKEGDVTKPAYEQVTGG